VDGLFRLTQPDTPEERDAKLAPADAADAAAARQAADESGSIGEVTDPPMEIAERPTRLQDVGEGHVAVQNTQGESSVYDFSRRRHGSALPT
jgi:hypothetical protein